MDEEQAAFAELVDRYREPLLARIRLMLGEEARRRANSVDFLHGAFAELLAEGRTGDLRDETQVLRRVTAIARNNVRDAVRRPRERAFQSLSLSVSGLRPGTDDASPSHEVARREQALALVEALERLSEDHRAVIELRDLEGLDFAAFGEELGRGSDAAQMLHTRAMVKLGILLGDG